MYADTDSIYTEDCPSTYTKDGETRQCEFTKDHAGEHQKSVYQTDHVNTWNWD